MKGYHIMSGAVVPAGLLSALRHVLSPPDGAGASVAALWRPWPLPVAGGTVAALSLPALDALLGDIVPASLHPAIPARCVRSRQLSFLAGRLCAEQALAGLPLTAAVLARDPSGRPRWPVGVTGSITHSPTLAAAVAAWSPQPDGLGVDCEPLAAGGQLDDIVSACCTAADRACLPSRAAGTVATLIFSAKEAGYKALSHRFGRIVDFTEFEVCQLARDAGQLWLAPVPGSEWHRRIQPFAVQFTFDADSVYTLADLREMP